MTFASFVIHASSTTEREANVEQLKRDTNCTVVEAVWFSDELYVKRKEGCSRSHMKVAQLAKDLHPDDPYLVFEDDCQLGPNWTEALDMCETYDLVYLGVLPSYNNIPFGTHALWITPTVRDAILSDSEAMAFLVRDPWAFDHILHQICQKRGFRVKVPLADLGKKYAKQGVFPSTVSIRKFVPPHPFPPRTVAKPLEPPAPRIGSKLMPRKEPLSQEQLKLQIYESFQLRKQQLQLKGNTSSDTASHQRGNPLLPSSSQPL